MNMSKFLRPWAVVLFAVAAIPAFGQTDETPERPVSTPPAVVSADPLAAVGSDERYRIGFQDTLEVKVFRHPELTQRVNVNSNGTINLFRLDMPIVAVCKTERELANDIADAYRKDYLRNPEVNVVAAEQRSRAFSVIGAVEKPGSYFIARRVRLLELLAQAGGQTKDAGNRVLVARTGSTSDCKMDVTAAQKEQDLNNVEVLSFRMSDILEGRQNLVMTPGDVVSVLDADIVYVYGNVNEQGQVKMTEPLTLTQAIASAKGLKGATKKDKVRIIRQKPNSSEREELVFDLNAIDKRTVEDPFLEPNDIVAVSEDKMKSIMNSIGRSLTTGVPNVFYRFP